jgi:hypothetical protein
MSHKSCFSRANQNITAGENTKYKKQRTIFKGAVNVAEKNGFLLKGRKINGKFQPKGVYIGDIYTSHVSPTDPNTTQTQSLVGAKSYESLYDVTMGKYLTDPLAFGIANSGNIWEGSVYLSDLSGIIGMTATILDGVNYFIYPPNPNSTNEYPNRRDPSGCSVTTDCCDTSCDCSNNIIQSGGMYIDPFGDYFFRSDNSITINNGSFSQINRSICYTDSQIGWQNHVTYDENLFKRYALRYLGIQNGIISPVIYPASNLPLKCEKNWLKDISNGVIWNGYVPGFKSKSI